MLGLVVFTIAAIVLNGTLIHNTYRCAFKTGVDVEERAMEEALDLSQITSSKVQSERNLNAYEAIQQEIFAGKRPLKLSINGVWKNGYANRMYSLITSFVIGVLSESALLIKWKKIEAFYQPPFNMTFHDFAGQASEFNVDYKLDEVHNFTWSANSWRIKKTLDGLVSTEIPRDKKRIYYFHIEAEFFAICSNPAYYEQLYASGLVERHTIDDAYSVLRNESLKADEATKVDTVLRVGFQVGGNVLRHYWRPTETLASKIDYYYERFFKGFYVIGIQVRVQFLQGAAEFLSIFTECALNVEKYTAAAQGRPVRWFVTSDQQSVIDQLLAKYPDKIVQTNGTIGHIYVSDVGLEKTLLDSELLALADEMITTGASSYGFLAAMKAGRLPLFVQGAFNVTKCQRATLYAPPTTLEFACF